jgi:hypothetical protein
MMADELQNDEREAAGVVAKIKDEARAAITDVLIDGANTSATHILTLEAEAVLFRTRLGGQLDPVGQLRVQLIRHCQTNFLGCLWLW